jgi:hypothetical protein
MTGKGPECTCNGGEVEGTAGRSNSQDDWDNVFLIMRLAVESCMVEK